MIEKTWIPMGQFQIVFRPWEETGVCIYEDEK